MIRFKRLIAVTELLLILPSSLFMTALALRSLPRLQPEQTLTAQRIVMWYAARPWTLWLLLIVLPIAGLVIGCVAFLYSWKDDGEIWRAAQQPLEMIRTHLSMLVIAAETLAAGVFLAVAVLHMLMN
jgi:hypothetical protein